MTRTIGGWVGHDRGKKTMTKRAAAILISTALTTILWATPGAANKYAVCPSGWQSYVVGPANANRLMCRQPAGTKWELVALRGCPPGTTLSKNEANNGGDLCAAAGGNVAGPALPCAPGQRLTIVQKGRDRCEKSSPDYKHTPPVLRDFGS